MTCRSYGGVFHSKQLTLSRLMLVTFLMIKIVTIYTYGLILCPRRSLNMGVFTNHTNAKKTQQICTEDVTIEHPDVHKELARAVSTIILMYKDSILNIE